MSERIGFFICHCGINIASRVRVKDVAEYAATLPNVVVAKDYLFNVFGPRAGSDRKGDQESKPHSCGRGLLLAPHARKNFRAACQRAGSIPIGRSTWSVSGSNPPGSRKARMRRPRRRSSSPGPA